MQALQIGRNLTNLKKSLRLFHSLQHRKGAGGRLTAASTSKASAVAVSKGGKKEGEFAWVKPTPKLSSKEVAAAARSASVLYDYDKSDNNTSNNNLNKSSKKSEFADLKERDLLQQELPPTFNRIEMDTGASFKKNRAGNVRVPKPNSPEAIMNDFYLAVNVAATNRNVTRAQVDEFSAEFFKLMNGRAHSNLLITKLSNCPLVLLAYYQHFYGSGRISGYNMDTFIKTLSGIIDLFPLYPAEVPLLIEATIKKRMTHLRGKEDFKMNFSQFSKLLMKVITFPGEKDDSIALLDSLRFLEPLLNTKLPELNEYLMHWAYLSTLDVLESVIVKEMHKSIGRATFKRKTEPGGTATHVMNLKASSRSPRSNTLFRLSNGRHDLFCTTIYNTVDFTVLLAQVHTNQFSPFNFNEVPGDWEVFEVTTLAPYTGQITGLDSFAKKGAAIPMYKYLLNSEDGEEVAPPAKLNLISKSLNHSQISAILNAMTGSLTLIQGPPGTGKTHTLAALIKSLLVSSTQKITILVTTPTNSAADNVIDFLRKLGITALRIGDMDSIRSDIQPFSLGALVPNPLVHFDEAMRTIRKSEVLVSTVFGAANPYYDRMKVFDYLIVDESSQLTEPGALIPISLGPQKVILVGDHQQLPPSVGYWASQGGYSVSLFSRMANKVKPNLLRTQYRSHPLIMSISNKLFYNGELEHGVTEESRPIPRGFPWNDHPTHGKPLPVAFVHTNYGEVGGVSKSNPGEANLVVKIVRNFLKAGAREEDIGIISPYSGQNQMLRRLLEKQGIVGVEQNSVDAFQGREKDIIIFSATRSNDNGSIGFLSDHRRFNVMHTRAKRGLVVVGNGGTLKHDPTWLRWLKWIQEENLIVKESAIHN